ncbi:hypothetical protein HYC85_003927 [Camellia sinensis]|uniref:Uncharacterized protein n=1 Tax=Camellia sinensis TaxID=4442 RepID=A0A7J7HV12_CAMSI|nr:hypothetical protein HYC85_003927 [Camellia sinensis]
MFVAVLQRKPPYIVCNLTTKKFSFLPDIGLILSESYRKNAATFLAFDLAKLPHYKTSSWKHVFVPDPRGVPLLFSVFWNGAIHGISYANVHARFELEEEKLMQTPMPRNPKILSYDKIRILQMHRDYCKWIVKYRVVKGANKKDFTLVLSIRGKVISYNVKSKTLKELHDLSTDDLVATLYLAKQSMFGTSLQKSVFQNDLPDLDSLVIYQSHIAHCEIRLRTVTFESEL